MKRVAARIDGQRLWLRELRPWDMWTIGRLLRDKEISRFHFASDRELRRPGLVRKLARVFELSRVGFRAFWRRVRPSATRTEYKLAIVNKETARLVGVITLSDVADDGNSAGVGIWIGKDFWARGTMYEAEALLIRWAFETLGLDRIMAWAHCENVASIITMKKLGFDVTDASRQAKDIAGKTVNVLKLVLSRERFKGCD